MIHRLPVFILCVCGGLLLGAANAHASQPGAFSFDNIFPQISVSYLDDLDVRDAQNRSVTTPGAREQLAAIFESGLYALLVDAELPAVARSLSLIEKYLDLASQALTGSLPAAVQRCLAVLFPSRLRTQSALALFPSLFGGVLFLSFLGCFSHSLSSMIPRSVPLVIRC